MAETASSTAASSMRLSRCMTPSTSRSRDIIPVERTQMNNVHVDQSSPQIAGIGGHGGNGNAAMGGNGSIPSSFFRGSSDTIETGWNGAGNGGSGHFTGSLIDVGIVIYAPINIAIAGPHSTAEADQVNNVHVDQSAIQIAGVGGNGGPWQCCAGW